LVGLVAISGACSLHSLDYLSASASGDDDPSGGQGATDSGGAASSSGGGAQGGGQAHGGGGGGAGGMATAGSGGTGGTDTPIPEAGAGGAGAPEVPDCTDTEKTVDETDIDCGGRTCEPCPADKTCVTGTDCQSGICTNQVCQAPTCTDIAVNGDETDMNCGGKCPACALGQHCKVNADCSTKKCTEGMCESSVCQDGVLQDGCALLIDNTPYSLSPGHALTRCIDDNGQSTADGTAMILFSCKDELQQTFWAIAQTGGYFAFRSALSAKCLKVRGASKTENAIIEQATCDYSAAQLWKPSRIDDSLMQLTNKLSALALDVSGANVDADNQGITQGKVDDSADTHWRVQRRSTAAYLGFSASDDSSNRIHHGSSTVTLQRDDKPSAQWRVVPGLFDAEYVSFQSRDEPGRYLRHASYRLWADTSDGSSQFKQDATFRFHSPFVGSSTATHAFESNNYPGLFWQRNGTTISLTSYADNSGYKAAATWTILPR
jgi:hypothetical protein